VHIKEISSALNSSRWSRHQEENPNADTEPWTENKAHSSDGGTKVKLVAWNLSVYRDGRVSNIVLDVQEDLTGYM
jgi:hypothetical protein